MGILRPLQKNVSARFLHSIIWCLDLPRLPYPPVFNIFMHSFYPHISPSAGFGLRRGFSWTTISLSPIPWPIPYTKWAIHVIINYIHHHDPHCAVSYINYLRILWSKCFSGFFNFQNLSFVSILNLVNSTIFSLQLESNSVITSRKVLNTLCRYKWLLL